MKLKKIVTDKLFISGALLVVIIIYLTYSILTEERMEEIQLPTQEEEEEEIANDLKTILYWNPMFGRLDHWLGTGKEIFQNCRYKNCYATPNKKKLPIDKYDAIIFHIPTYHKSGKPDKRNSNQRYIFEILESPINSPDLTKDYNNFFNWTMTYRSDSDIIRPYGRVLKMERNYTLPSKEEIQSRPNKIAWFVSHCHTPSGREVLGKELSKLIPIDIYGSCGKLKCVGKQAEDCYIMLEKKYKFYLSFENSICEDYVTEKFYKILKKDVVPIVYGGANYEKIAPRNSYINVIDFNTTQELAKYIQFLDNNPEEYLKYFEWKKDFVVVTHNGVLCDLCEKLNKPLEEKIYRDISLWWKGPPDESKCHVLGRFTEDKSSSLFSLFYNLFF